MRNLEILPKISDSEITHLQSLLNYEFKGELILFFKKYLNSRTKENYFISKEGLEWRLHQFSNYPIMVKYLQKSIEQYDRKLLHFGLDEGGWNFCVSFDEDTMGKVIIDRTENDDPEEQFVIIADSFEEFINGLQEIPY
jgi:thymidine kinase